MQIYFLLWNALKRRSDGIYNLHIQHLGENDKISRVVASSLVVHSRERGSSSDNVVCFVMLNLGGGDIPKYGKRKREAPDTWANIAILYIWWWVVVVVVVVVSCAHCPVLVTGPIVWTRSSLPWVDLLAAGPWDLNTDWPSLHCVLTTC